MIVKVKCEKILLFKLFLKYFKINSNTTTIIELLIFQLQTCINFSNFQSAHSSITVMYTNIRKNWKIAVYCTLDIMIYSIIYAHA